jgi:hypothetical protein
MGPIIRSEREALTELGAFNARREAERKAMEESAANKWPMGKRLEAVKSGDALPGGLFPIKDQEDLNNAAGLAGSSKVPEATVVAHIKKQAKKHSLKLPDSWQDD